jgi:hypothetical protein
MQSINFNCIVQNLLTPNKIPESNYYFTVNSSLYVTDVNQFSVTNLMHLDFIL